MSLDLYVIDARGGRSDGLFIFNPVELNEAGEIIAVVSGLNFLSTEPPDGAFFGGVTHPDGQEACEAFVEEHRAAIEDLKERRGCPPPAVEQA